MNDSKIFAKYYSRSRSNFLAHHGVKGQKWGVKNGPPYPLHRSVNGASINKRHRANTDKEFKDCVTGINPSHSKTNCGSVSTAVVNNLNGYVKAIALDEVPNHMKLGNGYDPDKLIDCYDGGKWEEIHRNNRKELSEAIETQILEYGDGANGIVYCDQYTHNRHGHYTPWAVKDSKVYLLEGQPASAQDGSAIYSGDLYDALFKQYDVNATTKIARLDNCTIKPGREKDLFIRQ